MIRALAVVLAVARRSRQNHRVPTLEVYPFRFRDPLTGKWVRARHKLQVPALQRRYAEWEITGAPEIRHVTELSALAVQPVQAVSVTRIDSQSAAARRRLARLDSRRHAACQA